MVRLEGEFRKAGFALLGITNESAALVEAYYKAQGFRFATVLDPTDEVSDQYGFSSTPTIIFVGRHVQVLGRVIGTRDWDSPDGRAFLRHLLALP